MKAGAAQFPGGPQAWDQNHPDSWEALEPIARLDAHRGTPLDADSVRILIAHYSAWRTLFPYFEKLPGLDHRHFADLAEFSAAVGKLPAADQNIAVGEWDSLLELITRGSVSGYLDPAASADAFRSMCTTLAVADPSPAARNILARIVRPGDLDEAVPAWLLGLKGARRAAYDRVMQLQHVPRLAALARSPNETLAALSGIVYAATLDPDGLLVNENRQLLRRHRFAESSPFSVASLAHSPDGSYFRGGFSNFSEVARSLAPGGRERSADPNAPLDTAPSGPLEAGSFEVDPSAVVFRAAAKLVEVPVTVTDSSGRFVDDLSRSDFTLFDQGKPQSLVAFESRAAEVSVALLLDTTGSMHAALPTLKNAALRLIAGLRPADRVAVYSFNNSVTELQPFTTDKDAAKRAVLQTQALGETALYDALTRVGRDLVGRAGKKVIVVFTDGNDNSSTLAADTAILRAKAAGVPIYTIVQGDALLYPEFVKQLSTVSKATGGISFVIHAPGEIRAVFEKVAEDLAHGYLLVFQPAPSDEPAWRRIDLEIHGSRRYRIRAREGYYSQQP